MATECRGRHVSGRACAGASAAAPVAAACGCCNGDGDHVAAVHSSASQVGQAVVMQPVGQISHHNLQSVCVGMSAVWVAFGRSADGRSFCGAEGFELRCGPVGASLSLWVVEFSLAVRCVDSWRRS